MDETIGASCITMSRRGNIKGEKVWVKGKERGREKEKYEKIIINEFKDDIRSLDGLKTERQSMQKLEESC